MLQARSLVRAAEIAPDYIVGGEKLQLVGLTKQMRVMRRSATVTHPYSSSSIAAAAVPRFRSVHEEVWHVNLHILTSVLLSVQPLASSYLFALSSSNWFGLSQG